ncbi:MAG: hypothetical protein ACTS44_01690 [Candidatus Hodgkinia cicadicola]
MRSQRIEDIDGVKHNERNVNIKSNLIRFVVCPSEVCYNSLC